MSGSKDLKNIDGVRDVFEELIADFGQAVESRQAGKFANLFCEDGFWRDVLSFSWERRTFAGPGEIAEGFAATADIAHARNFRLAEGRAAPRLVRRSGRRVIEGWFAFDTAVGAGVGFVRLIIGDAGSRPRIWLLLTTLHTLTGGEEKVADRRPTGDEYSKIHSTENWSQQREAASAYRDRDPQVLVLGAGQSGLMLAARLRQMGVDVLVVDRIARIGDNWRARYNNLTIHNEITANHFPYMDFPTTWPLWLPKDMVADWLEGYARFMELNVWTSTELADARFDDADGMWTVRLRGPQGERTMRVPHLVAAMGVSGGLPKIPTLPGLADFGGSVIHSGAFTSGGEWAGSRALVVGTGNSGHDIVQDLQVSGAESVAIMQRGETCVISLEPCARISYAIYNEGVPTEDVDLMTAALPYPLLIETYQHITRKTDEVDRELLEGLRAAGFRTHTGDDKTGFQLCYLRGAGGYYIDVGCSQLIIDGTVPVIQYDDIDRFVAEGVRMRDGTVHPLDLVVLATGFESMQEGIRRTLGDAVADRVGPIWGFDEKKEMRNMWTRTAQDGFWVMGGSIIEARLNSRFLALEIKASLEGLLPAREDLPCAGWSAPAMVAA
jgi:cation diffusion facilitator CzcD-associated flavoprotein CzcO